MKKDNIYIRKNRKPLKKANYQQIICVFYPELADEHILGDRQIEIDEFHKGLEKLMKKYWVWTVWSQLTPSVA